MALSLAEKWAVQLVVAKVEKSARKKVVPKADYSAVKMAVWRVGRTDKRLAARWAQERAALTASRSVAQKAGPLVTR